MNTIILSNYEKNKNFRTCINNQLDTKDRDMVIKYGTKDLSELTDKQFKLYSNSLENILITIKEMNMHTIYVCVDKIMKLSEICHGKLIEQYLKLLNILYEFVDIKTNMNSKDINRVNIIIKKTIPHLRDIFKNLIKYTQLHSACNTSKSKRKLKMYQNIYNNLFENNESIISYKLFDNIDWKNNFIVKFTNSFIGKIILLIFIAFIFSQIISMYKPVSSSINNAK